MDKFGIFVDAGFLIAGGGSKCLGTTTRPEIRVNFQSLHEALVELGKDMTGLDHLRTYWYDAATDRVPTATHLAVARIDGVKLRLGRLTAQGQKGVDSLIVRDLITLASRRSLDTGILVGGDDDLTEGIREAQDFGVRMIVVGMESAQTSVSRSLAQEADQVVDLQTSFLSPHFARKQAPQVGQTPQDPRSVGQSYADQWVANATNEDIALLRGEFPFIPRDVDRELLAQGRAYVAQELSPDQLKILRDGFRNRINEVSAD